MAAIPKKQSIKEMDQKATTERKEKVPKEEETIKEQQEQL